ncbi:MAG TPA: nucleotidyltransferase family protein [Vineibacter sp.]|nr:nucleotidyltransferase family protein [Vineibacter sp.]
MTNGQPRQRVRPSVQLERYRSEIRAIVARHRGANPRVFGSVLRGTDTEDSDLDLLVDAEPGQRMTLFDLSAMFCEIEDLLQVPVDVQTTGGMPTRIREQIEREAQPV